MNRLLSAFCFSISILLISGVSFSANASGGYAREVRYDAKLGSCHFILLDSFGGRFKINRRSGTDFYRYTNVLNSFSSRPVETSIHFMCEHDENIGRYGIAYYPSSMRWGMSDEVQKDSPELGARFYPLHGDGWSGGAVSEVQSTGDANDRIESLIFCLKGVSQLVCGTVDNVGYNKYLKEAAIPKVIELLNAIKFVD